MITLWPDFKNQSLAFNEEEGKWEFNSRLYRRRGQAEKAAWKAWNKMR